MQIKSPEELQKISDEGQKSFEEQALESDHFKSVLSKIENSAMEGYTSWNRLLTRDADIRAYRVYEKALKEAGYEVEIKTEQHANILGVMYNQPYFVVSWKK